MRILVVEDNVPLLESITELLSSEFEVDSASSGDEGLFMAMQNIYDTIVLDVMLPEKDGFEIIASLRAEGIKTPVCFLTARDSLEDRVKGLNLGGDDYLVKPFQGPELIARVKALLRRSGALAIDESIQYGTMKLTGKENPIDINGEKVKFTLKQYELLEYMIHNQGVILTKEQIYDRVWGFESDTTMEIVEVFMHHIRKKLEPFGYHKHIQTVRGIGYQLLKSSEPV